ncbi:MAG: ATP-binding protein, partial [Cyanobacteria bacterium P01_D01_bin.105]
IEQLTAVAKRVTQDKNFQLQANINTQDEVALLAKALNQLVSWTGQYTSELTDARQHLEQRVEERTLALQQSETSLRQQADDLQQALLELQQTQLQLVQSEKMSSLGQMVAGIAHEINNPVSFIHGNLKHSLTYTKDVMELLTLYQKSYPTPTAEIQETIEEIDLPFLQDDFPKMMQSMKDGTTRIRDIVKSLRTFSRLDEAAVKEVDLHDGIDSTIVILNTRLKKTSDSPEIRVIRHYGELSPIECFAGQLNQVFMNILSNAIDALEDASNLCEPTITITTQSIDSEWVAIHIADNGPGIPDEVLGRLFDPFFTTKAVGKGTGMGLSISYQIVTEKHNGYLSCQSLPGQGAEFTIKLPVSLNR